MSSHVKRVIVVADGHNLGVLARALVELGVDPSCIHVSTSSGDELPDGVQADLPAGKLAVGAEHTQVNRRVWEVEIP